MKKIFFLLSMSIAILSSHAQEKLVALSFDDGPNVTTTLQMLDVLKKHGVKASFFCIGKNITPETAQSMVRAKKEGHDIENHSLTHCGMPSLTPDSMKSEIQKTSDLIEHYVGERPQLFRPPYIAMSKEMIEAIPLIFICGKGCEDWVAEVSADKRYETMLANAHDGVIFLLHDFEGNDNTVEAVDRIIPALKSRGYSFVTVRELFSKKGIVPQKGILYSNVYQTNQWIDDNL